MIIGRLGKDPEQRNGVTSFSVATDESYTDRSGQRIDRTEWHNVVVFGRAAEPCAQHLAKGSLVYVEGRIRTRKWQDRSGADRYTTEINADRVQFLDRRQDAAQQAAPAQRQMPSQAQTKQDDDWDAVPF
jgi:single-strand DNA-binding protein